MVEAPISSNNDLLTIIDSQTKAIPKYTKLVQEVVKSITAVEKMDFNPGLFAKMKMRKMSNMVDLYLACVQNIVDSFARKGSLGGSIDKILGWYQEDENGLRMGQFDSNNPKAKFKGKVAKTGYIVIDAAAQANKLIQNVLGGISSIANFKDGFLKAYIKIKLGSGLIKTYLNKIMSSVIDIFSKLNVGDINKIMPILVGDPEKIEQIADIDKLDEKNGAKSSQMLIDRSKTVTTKGRMGLIEAITNVFSMVGMVNAISLNPTKLILFNIKLNRLKKQISKIIQMVTNLIQPADVQGVSEQVTNINKVMAEQTGLMGIFLAIKNMIKTLDDLRGPLSRLARFNRGERGLIKFFQLIERIIEQCKKLNENALSETENKKIIAQLKSNRSIVTALGLLATAVALVSPIIAAASIVGLVLFPTLGLFVLEIKFIINKVKDIMNLQISKGLLALTAIFGVIILMTGAVWTLTLIGMKVVKNLPWALGLMLGILSLVGVIWLIARVTEKLAKASVWEGLLNLIVLMGAVFLLGVAMLALTFIAQQVVKGMGNTFLMILGIAGITVLLVGIGWLAASLSGVMALALSGMILIGSLILGLVAMSAMMKLLEVVNLDKDKIQANVTAIMDTAKSVIDSLFGSVVDDSKGSETPWYEKVLGFIGGTVGTLIKAILSVAVLAATIVSVFLITILAAQLKLLQNLDLNPDLIRTNVKTVVDTAKSIISLLFAPDDTQSQPTQKGFIRSVIETLGGGPMLNILDAIMGIAFLATSLVSITLISFIAGELRLLQTLNLQPDQIKANVKTVIDTAKSIVSQIMTPDDTQPQPKDGVFKKLLNWVMPAAEDLVDAISSIGFLTVVMTSVGMVTKIAKNLDTIQKTEDLSGVENKVGIIISSSKNILSSLAGLDANTNVNFISVGSKLSVLHNMNDIIKGFGSVDNSKLANGQKVLAEYGNFLTKVNDADLQKLQTAKNLVEQMAEFSASIRGNFQGLADSLNEKIAPLLQELQDLMKENQSGATSGSQQVVTPTGSPAQVIPSQSASAQTPAQDNSKMLATKLDQQVKQNQQLVDKIDELIDLFKYGQAKIAMS